MSDGRSILLALWIFASSAVLCVGMFYAVRKLALEYRPAFLVSVFGKLVPEFYFITGVTILFGYVCLMLWLW